MKWKGLYYAAKGPHHVATRTAGWDSNSAGSSVGGKRGVMQPQFLLSPAEWSGANMNVCYPPKALPPANRAHTQTHTCFIIMYDYTSTTPAEKVTNIQRHTRALTSSCTWVNVTVRHVLICWRYRVNDGRVVTFTQAGEFMQTLPGARGDGKARYVYGKTLSCPFIMEM